VVLAEVEGSSAEEMADLSFGDPNAEAASYKSHAGTMLGCKYLQF
jgi:hypothetical protein